ncbi:hypothetical protein CTKA_00590 [Chthonomonas calidirosea]|uniref:Two component regulator propeller n=1 Tax=Chthonomonas calidirosea (strain DSM 23976 / ICMP 18418 / T49) TaxID=1303518 RepID=S0ESS0_CHTCT|nr:hypothetical protein [Chthonomonas calidirosea]CCW34396.1 hypothetical protein CCALI_00565 [Chthonomonas calidirosea T49]CEK14894.1 hypothetical protein CTKA_00590 [Chthonomonas calidirosea]
MRALTKSSAARSLDTYLQDVATPLTALDDFFSKNVCRLAVNRNGTLCFGTEEGIFYQNRRRAYSVIPKLLSFGFLPDNRLVLLGSDQLVIEGEEPLVLPQGIHVVGMSISPEGDIYIATRSEIWRRVKGKWESFGIDVSLCSFAVGAYTTIWIAGNKRLYVYEGGVLQDVDAVAPPPVLPVRCMDLGADGVLWIGTRQGAACLRDGVWRYYAGRRWLPDNEVLSVAADQKGGAWIMTRSGVVHLERRPMTLLQKAEHYQRLTEQRHERNGYVAECFLTRPGDLESVLLHATDNDGLWTGLYLAAQSFRYAVTGEKEAAERARRSLRALLDLVYVTGVPGFPARALIRPGERVFQSDPGPNWYLSPTMPGTFFKGDTSSDEIDGHYLAWYLYYKLVANEEEKTEIAEVCRAVTDHILDNGFTLVGPDGKVTSWGVWTPEKINDDPDWVDERGLNALEILSHLRVALYLCPSLRYEEAYSELVRKHHYALNTLLQKVLPPLGVNNHSDDELAACAYYPLLQLESDPSLRALYLLSLERTQRILRPQRSAFHNILYAACTGRKEDVGAAITWLEESPLDLRNWAMKNSHRRDVKLATERDRFGRLQLEEVLSPAEVGVYKWNANPFVADTEGEGEVELDGSHWLLPYWMGRYHGLIGA